MRGKREVSCRHDVGIGTRCDGTTSQCAWRQGSRMDTWVWGGGVTRCDMTAIRWTRGKWEERRQRTRGGGAARGGGGASWGRGAAVARRRWRDERTRGGGGATKVATQQPAQWEALQQSVGGGVLKAGKNYHSFSVKYHTIPYYWHQECRGMCVWPNLLFWTLSFRNFRYVNIWTARQSWVWYFARLLNMRVYI